MNSKPIDVTDSGKGVNLPKPDPANITVLTPKLPNKPILPWTHFDSPWLEEEGEEPSTQQETSAENQDNLSEASADSQKLTEATENPIEPSATKSNPSEDSQKLTEATENPIEPSATESNPSEDSDTTQEATTQQTPITEIPVESSQLPEKENKI
ncbi:MAG: hypothetical protein QNJ36_16035 [Calothrix sp. MO_167.B42]|nr:hypothetical protein [Calothrix sp. MO_167.B42]